MKSFRRDLPLFHGIAAARKACRACILVCGHACLLLLRRRLLLLLPLRLVLTPALAARGGCPCSRARPRVIADDFANHCSSRCAPCSGAR